MIDDNNILNMDETIEYIKKIEAIKLDKLASV
jgi:hypothetical protein